MEDRRQPGKGSNIKRGISGVLAAVMVTAGIGGGFAFGTQYPGAVKVKKAAASGNYIASKDSIPAEGPDWDKLNEIRDMLYEKYNGEIDDEKLLEGAVKGMVDSLGDPYTVFFNEEEFKALNEQNNGKFIGVGLQVGIKDDKIVVIAPIDGGPAKEAGILTGDIIFKVDGEEYGSKDMEAAVKHMRGEEGKEVTITVIRNGEEKEFTIKRREINVASVRSEMLDDKIGLVTLSQFTRASDREFKKALDDLKKDGAEGYIVDLRGNPGGYLNESINIAGNFIQKGDVVVSTIDKDDNRIEDKSMGGNYIGVPLVLLIDGGSASASEVVSGALKDYDAAVLIGEKTFGKGVVQTVIDLPGGEGLKVTVASYYSPKGTNINKIGIEPDIKVPYPEELREKPYDQKTDPQLLKAIEEIKSKMGEEKKAA